jgi:hypothetical protein
MIVTDPFDIYDFALTIRVRWQAHSLSTAGTNGSNRLMPRRQLLSNGQETDACSGSIAKHHHAALLAEYCQESRIPLCPACTTRDGRRAAALVDRPAYKDQPIEAILQQCALCDAHGFLVTAKKASREPGKPRHQPESEPSASHDSETEASARERNYSGGFKKRRASEGPSNGKRMTSEDSNKSLKHSMTLLAHGRKVGANATEAGRAVLGPEGARNLLLDFGHAQISLGLIIGLSRQLHRLHLFEKEHLRSLILFIPCMGSNLRSSIIATIGEIIASHFTRPRIVCAHCPPPGQALRLQTPVWFKLMDEQPFGSPIFWL